MFQFQEMCSIKRVACVKFICILLINRISSAFGDAGVSNFIRHFEPVYYDHVTLKEQHHVTRRSTDVPVTFHFTAFDRLFEPVLKIDTHLLHPEMEVETNNGSFIYTKPMAYTGFLKDSGEAIHGIITKDGHFEGKIISSNETYFIEQSKHYFKQPVDHHTFIYRQSDVTFNTSRVSCAHAQLREKQKAMMANVDFNINGNDLKRMRNNNGNRKHEYENNWKDKYRKDGRYDGNDDVIDVVNIKRRKRAIDPQKTICELYMQADHLFYAKYGSDVEVIIEKLTAHVQAIDSIYKLVDFDDSGAPDNIGFIIKKIKVWTDPTVVGYKYDGNFAVDYFLDLHSTDNYDDYCLSYLFTYRDFSDGVLGLAWVGDTSSAGGVCEIFRTYSGGSKSLNTGIVTTLNYGTDVPAAVSHITFAHEMGHNFGSNHDPEGSATCTPGGSAGNYIMYARATDGSKPNNNELSSCSITAIARILEAKARDSSTGCFVPFSGEMCGNRVVEGSEECDCGWDTECTEGCCNPQVEDPSAPGVETPCTRISSAVCSPSEGACCQNDCSYSPNTVVCRAETDCLEEASCDGSSTVCPASVHKANGTSCGDSDDVLVCYAGECTGAVCQANGREPCQCESGNPKDEILCNLCCIDGQTCKSSYELADIPDAMALAGTPCNSFQGYCDVFKKCREVNPEGPLSNLKKLFFSGEGLNALKEFLTKRWYVGVAVAVGLIIVIVGPLVFTHLEKKGVICKKGGRNGDASRSADDDQDVGSRRRSDDQGDQDQNNRRRRKSKRFSLYYIFTKRKRQDDDVTGDVTDNQPADERTSRRKSFFDLLTGRGKFSRDQVTSTSSAANENEAIQNRRSQTNTDGHHHQHRNEASMRGSSSGTGSEAKGSNNHVMNDWRRQNHPGYQGHFNSSIRGAKQMQPSQNSSLSNAPPHLNMETSFRDYGYHGQYTRSNIPASPRSNHSLYSNLDHPANPGYPHHSGYHNPPNNLDFPNNSDRRINSDFPNNLDYPNASNYSNNSDFPNNLDCPNRSNYPNNSDFPNNLDYPNRSNYPNNSDCRNNLDYQSISKCSDYPDNRMNYHNNSYYPNSDTSTPFPGYETSFSRPGSQHSRNEREVARIKPFTVSDRVPGTNPSTSVVSMYSKDGWSVPASSMSNQGRGTSHVVAHGSGNDVRQGRGTSHVVAHGSGNDVRQGRGTSHVVAHGSGNDVMQWLETGSISRSAAGLDSPKRCPKEIADKIKDGRKIRTVVVVNKKK